ncbi:MAG: PEP-CTERM sorting domain-containing protein [Pseudomonadota bacterium]
MMHKNLATVLGTAALLGASLSAHAWTVDFESDINGNTMVHGQVLNIEQASGFPDWSASAPTTGPYATGTPGNPIGPAMEIRAYNNTSGSTTSEFAVVFDSREHPTRDSDLESPFEGPFKVYTYDNQTMAQHDGGVLADAQTAAQLQMPGNIAIVQENFQSGGSDLARFPGCYDGICTHPDDEFASGSNTIGQIIFEFDSPATLFSIDVFDIEDGSEQAARIDFWDEDGFFACVHFPETGDNGAARLVFNGGAGYENVVKAKVTFNGSGAIDNLVGDSPTGGGGDPQVSAPGTLALVALSLFGLRMRRRRG